MSCIYAYLLQSWCKMVFNIEDFVFMPSDGPLTMSYSISNA